MYLERLKLVSIRRAARLIGIDKASVAKAINVYRLTNGAKGLAHVIPAGCKRPLIRLCAIDDWLHQQEEISRYA